MIPYAADPTFMRTVHLTLALALAALPAAAQSSSSPPAHRPLLWRIERADPCYLFGTIHLTDPRVASLPPLAETALRAAGAVYTELDMSPETAERTARIALLPSGQTNAAWLPDDLEADLDRSLRAHGSSLARVEPLTLPALTLQATALLSPHPDSGDTVPQDLRIWHLARQLGKQVGGLETPEQMVQSLADLQPSEHIAVLRSLIDATGTTPADAAVRVDELVRLYRQGNANALQRLAIQRMPGQGHLKEKVTRCLLHDRNHRMADRIEDKLRTHRTTRYFFAVGVAHLGGPKGIVARLRDKGFAIHRVPQRRRVEGRQAPGR